MANDLIFVSAERAHAQHQTDSKVIAVKRWERGFYPIQTPRTPEELNRESIPESVLESAVSASIFGWDAPVAREAHDWFDQQTRKRVEAANDQADPGPEIFARADDILDDDKTG